MRSERAGEGTAPRAAAVSVVAWCQVVFRCKQPESYLSEKGANALKDSGEEQERKEYVSLQADRMRKVGGQRPRYSRCERDCVSLLAQSHWHS